MPAAKLPSEQRQRRKLRDHKKSRYGCRNCRLRKVKCDEVKPQCQKCSSYRIRCNYDLICPDLQIAAKGMTSLEILQLPPFSEHKTILSIINTTPDSFGDKFTVQDLETLRDFHHRTCWTLGASNHRGVYQNAFVELTHSHRFLMHIVLTLTLLHDRYLGIDKGSDQLVAIASHWSQGASSLNKRISQGLLPSERDAAWACAGLLGALAFASIEAETVEEAWPSNPKANIEWIKMCQGKKEIWKLSDPLRADSIFAPLREDFLLYHSLRNAFNREDLSVLPTELLQLCHITESSTPENNVYFGGLGAMARLSNVDCNSETLVLFLSLFGCMGEPLTALLAKRDPAAMMILALWYAKVRTYRTWWLAQRAVLELESILRYTREHYADNTKLMDLLQFIERVAAGKVKIRAEESWLSCRNESIRHLDSTLTRKYTLSY